MSTKGQERTKGVRDCPAEWPPSAFSAETLHLSSFVVLKAENFVSELRMSTKGLAEQKQSCELFLPRAIAVVSLRAAVMPC